MNGGAFPIAVVGGGVMAQSIVRGGLDAGVLVASAVAVAEPESAKRDLLRSWGVTACRDAGEAAHWLVGAEPHAGAGQVLLAVKPQSFEAAAAKLRPAIGPARRVILTIMAGVTTEQVRASLGEHVAVVRLMPNLPVRVRRSTTAVAPGAGTREGDEQFAVELFGAVGRTITIPEPLMDAFTAVAGSGPAYLFYLAEAMTKSAMGVGFDRDAAEWIVRWTLAGAAALLDATDQPPETLRSAVTSKGGTTAAAVAVLDEAKVIDAFVRAIAAARDRGRELAGS